MKIKNTPKNKQNNTMNATQNMQQKQKYAKNVHEKMLLQWCNTTHNLIQVLKMQNSKNCRIDS